MTTRLPRSVEILKNPSQERLRALALAHTPACSETACNNLVKVSRNKARMARYTYVIAPESEAEAYSHKVMAREKAQGLIDAQSRYIAKKGQVIQIEGFLGVGPRAVGVTWSYTLEGANIAGMQQVLSFPASEVTDEPFQPQLEVIYTPGATPDSISLSFRAERRLFTGAFIYLGALDLFLPCSNL